MARRLFKHVALKYHRNLVICCQPCEISSKREFSVSSLLLKDKKDTGDKDQKPGMHPGGGKLAEPSTNPLARDFGRYEIVLPMEVSEALKVPDCIQKPSYYSSGYVRATYSRDTPEVKTAEQITKLRESCSLAREVLNAVLQQAKEGVTTDYLDKFFHDLVISKGAYPSSLNYGGFPKSICTSVNNVACHGIPDNRPLKDSDIVNIDIMVYYNGYHGDCSETMMIGNVDAPGKKLVEIAKECLHKGIEVCGPGVPYSEIGKAIEKLAEDKGFCVVPAFTGHGIGQYVHGPPDVYHIDFPYPGTMQPGNTFTIEPVITQGLEEIVILEDGWTAVTLDGARTAQFEHTVLITETGVEILTPKDL